MPSWGVVQLFIHNIFRGLTVSFVTADLEDDFVLEEEDKDADEADETDEEDLDMDDGK